VAVAILAVILVIMVLARQPDRAPSPATTASSDIPPATATVTPATTSASTTPVSPTTAAEPSKSPEATGGSAVIPAGFRLHTDPTGFSVAVPKGWVRSVRGSGVYFRDPAGRGFLQVDQTNEPKPDVLADWKNQESYVAKRLPDYHRIRIERIDYKGWQAADWEFTWSATYGKLHVINRNIRVNDEQAYALYWSIPAGQWQAKLYMFRIIAKSFTSAT
jgi:hypothetical protein